MEFISTLIMSLSVAWLGWLLPSTVTTSITEDESSETVLSLEVDSLPYDDQLYGIYSEIIESPYEVTIGNNLEDKSNAQKIYDTLSCKSLINGSFYTPEYKAIGLVVTKGVVEQSFEPNSLFNSTVSVKDNILSINRGNSYDPNLTSALQTGPILIHNRQTQSLQLTTDKQSRRSFIGLDADNSVVIGMVTLMNNQFSGPFLEDLPQILTIWAKIHGINFISATNLDGGRASAFISDHHSENEISLIGSYICFK